MKHKIILPIFLLLAFSPSTHADIYECQDKNGTTSFQSKPCTQQQVLIREIEKTPKGVAAQQTLNAIVVHGVPDTPIQVKQELPFYIRWFNQIKIWLGFKTE